MKHLTIVVPSYNTEAYIDTCLPTMIDERYIQDIEILLINDGSTDRTKEMLEKYEKQYPESIKVINKENGGHGSVINRGIQEATGRYFRVIDGDDFVDTDNLYKLVDKLKSIDSDIVFTSLYEEILTKNKNFLRFSYSNVEEGKVYLFDDICLRIGCIPLHAINYRTSLLKNNKIRVQEKCYYEDKEYILYPIPFVKTIAYYNFPVYHYRIGVPGQSVSTEKVLKNKKMLELITQNLCVFYENTLSNQDISNVKKQYLSNAICEVIKNMYGIYLKFPLGVEPLKMIKNATLQCRNWSPNLYRESNVGIIKFLRKNSCFVYLVAYISFRLVRMIRGF